MTLLIESAAIAGAFALGVWAGWFRGYREGYLRGRITPPPSARMAYGG